MIPRRLEGGCRDLEPQLLSIPDRNRGASSSSCAPKMAHNNFTGMLEGVKCVNGHEGMVAHHQRQVPCAKSSLERGEDEVG